MIIQLVRNLQVWRVIVAVVLLVGVLAACGRSQPTAPPGEVVRLGALVPLSGDNGTTGQRMAFAYQMAIQEANDGGGVLGRRVELLTGDDACDPGSAVQKAHELISRGIIVSVGGSCSVATVPVLRVFRDAGIPMIIPAANSTDLLAPRYDSIFLLAGTTKIEGERATKALKDFGSRRLAVVDDGTSFPQTLAEATVATVQQPGSEIAVAAQLSLSQGATGYPRIVETIMRERADVVFFTGYYPEAATLIRNLRDANYQGKIILSDGGIDPVLLTVLSAAEAEGVYGLSLPMPQFEPRAAAWSARYKAAHGQEPGPYTMQAYDAVRLAINAIQRAGTLDRDAVRKAIASTTPGDIELLSGPSEFNPDGTQVEPVFILLQIRNGALTLVPESGK